MTLKVFSFIDLLQMGGYGGDSGCQATVYARFDVPTADGYLSPLPIPSGQRGDATSVSGDIEIQYPCGFEGVDPTVPTFPTGSAAAPAQSQVTSQDWRALDRAYQQHHINCRFCIAAGRGARYGLRCGVGAALWRAYSEIAMTETTINPRRLK